MCMWQSVAPAMRSVFMLISSWSRRSGDFALRIMPQTFVVESLMASTELRMLKIEIDRGVALVTLNRPESMNALNIALRDEIVEIAVALDANDAVNAVVFTGAGDK